jgi:hypothetical protein
MIFNCYMYLVSSDSLHLIGTGLPWPVVLKTGRVYQGYKKWLKGQKTYLCHIVCLHSLFSVPFFCTHPSERDDLVVVESTERTSATCRNKEKIAVIANKSVQSALVKTVGQVNIQQGESQVLEHFISLIFPKSLWLESFYLWHIKEKGCEIYSSTGTRWTVSLNSPVLPECPSSNTVTKSENVLLLNQMITELQQTRVKLPGFAQVGQTPLQPSTPHPNPTQPSRQRSPMPKNIVTTF